MSIRKSYPTDVTDEEWAFVAPYLTLLTPDAPQRRHDLRDVFNAGDADAAMS
jgi:transposase